MSTLPQSAIWRSLPGCTHNTLPDVQLGMLSTSSLVYLPSPNGLRAASTMMLTWLVLPALAISARFCIIGRSRSLSASR